MLGGTGVIISGPCFNDDNIYCNFGSKSVKGVIMENGSLLLCVTPEMTHSGEVKVKVRINGTDYKSVFFSSEFTCFRRLICFIFDSACLSVSPERAYSVDFTPGGLIFVGGETRTITWSPDSIIPSHLDINVTDIFVDITLYSQEVNSHYLISYDWNPKKTLNSKVPNLGQTTVVIPSDGLSCKYPTYTSFELGVCPIVIKVSLASTDFTLTRELSGEIGQWSGVGFFKSKEIADDNLRDACETWSEFDQESSRLRNLIPCPPTLRLIRFDPAFQEIQLTSTAGKTQYNEEAMNVFHPRSHVCFNEVK